MLKKTAVVIALSTMIAGVAYAGSAPKSGINGSMHDINAVAGYQHDKFERTCVFCHTPHNAQDASAVPAPLWNHAPSTVSLAPYTWASPMNLGITFNADPLVGPSRLCMACHDGVTAVDSHGTAGSTPVGTTKMTSSYVDGLGNTAKRYVEDLTVTHPIGFLWSEAVTARNNGQDANEIVPASFGFIKDGFSVMGNFDTHNSPVRTAGNTNQTSKKIQDTLYSGYMTCASCHDVHNSVNATPDAGHNYNYFLYAQQEGSKICLSCHIK